MNEYDNVREALKDAIEYTEVEFGKDTKEGNVTRPTTIKDVQELIQEPLYSIADLLGMSDIYLEGKTNEE
ncbi:hypothetical protein [Pediococcus claussenii]|uniref:Uncharacterized protein n=1 Tax=Pediococcus claussenii (strain ATCC BAA-344 / DSM 14800 / JCM 18046 / KCTC 3811 / LMG 21948 / P06) TaxID=701521 RepID=G8PCA5_PEDCP|nr:hypothetical protein [Pediococcus claussenii]AEV94890.1 hypothetical protein PECL_592 [Pediococcus claussenii ATCC BAA-344]ANZ70086.1 hypothetical protein AYR57_07040 [Pediococcus claussenii]ANZ71901.1 hypothetical protein AYR58_07040 [Pediococcus claussenii]KRN18806.1 hypothetical protein IV79_GL000357 [Pediococcus claussenii]